MRSKATVYFSTVGVALVSPLLSSVAVFQLLGFWPEGKELPRVAVSSSNWESLSAASVSRSPLREWKSDVVYKNLCKNDGASAYALVS